MTIRAVVLMMVSRGTIIQRISRDVKRGRSIHDVKLYKKQQGGQELIPYQCGDEGGGTWD